MLTASLTQDFRWGAEVMADRHVRNPDAALSGAAKAHYPALQSARGLAAIAVLTCHSLLVFETSGGIHALARITEPLAHVARSEEHTSELQSLLRTSYAVSCLKKKKNN